MAKSRANRSGEERRGELPSAAELLAFIRDSPTAVGKREIARAFAVAPGDRPELRDMLREIERSGRRRARAPIGALSPPGRFPR